MSKRAAKDNSREIVISPVTRLEGHAKINIFLNDKGNVEDTYFQVVELRGFEKFCQGRPAEEMPRIVPRICGVCPNPHHMASGKAVDMVFDVDPPDTAKKLREMSLNAHMIYSHTTHFYFLAGPDFIMGPDSDPAMRNIVGVINKLGAKIGRKIIKGRQYAQRIQEIISGRATHPINNLPGGIAKGITNEQQMDIENMGKTLVEFGKFTLQMFGDIFLKNKEYASILKESACEHKTYYMGTIDKKNNVSFYDGDIRVVNPKGREFIRFDSKDYLKHIAEHVEPWSYLKFSFLRNVGWRGFLDGEDSGIYRVGPLARLNASDGMATPLANEAYETMYETLGGKPIHDISAMHWARVIEIMYAAERIMELVHDTDITNVDVRNIPTHVVGEGIGEVEAPRGTLFHHYRTDEDGIMQRLNILVATGSNSAGICMSVKRTAEKLIHGFRINPAILNRVEMAFRAYDPCLACATHTLPGHMPIEIRIYDSDGNIYRRISRFE